MTAFDATGPLEMRSSRERRVLAGSEADPSVLLELQGREVGPQLAEVIPQRGDGFKRRGLSPRGLQLTQDDPPGLLGQPRPHEARVPELSRAIELADDQGAKVVGTRGEIPADPRTRPAGGSGSLPSPESASRAGKRSPCAWR